MRAASAVSNLQRILIVEDNHDSALSLKMLLEVLGHEVDVVHDGEAAVSLAADRQPEVVLMDIGLPRMNGYEAARRIRSDCQGRSLVIVALTGWGQQEDRRKSADAGIDHHLVKPLDLEKLMQILGRGQASASA